MKRCEGYHDVDGTLPKISQGQRIQETKDPSFCNPCSTSYTWPSWKLRNVAGEIIAISMNLIESWAPGSKVLQKLDMVKQRVSWKQKHIKIIWVSWKQMDTYSFLGGFWVGKAKVFGCLNGRSLCLNDFCGGKVWETKKFGCLDPSNKVPSKIVGKLGAAWKFQWLFESQKCKHQNGEPSACPRTFLYHPSSNPGSFCYSSPCP